MQTTTTHKVNNTHNNYGRMKICTLAGGHKIYCSQLERPIFSVVAAPAIKLNAQAMYLVFD